MLAVLLTAGATTVAEAAFQDRLWRPNLEPLTRMADVRIIRCTVPAATAHARIAERIAADAHRTAHADTELLKAIAAGNSPIESFVPITMNLPTLIVDTGDGYRPALTDIVAFATQPTA